jgi:Eukaryotic aspartyl protease
VSSSSSGSSSSAVSSSSSGGVPPSGPAGDAIPLAAPDGADFEYTAQVTVGNQTFTMSIDTGSTTLGVAGTGCTGCTGVSPLYTASSSAMATGQKGDSEYEDGSGWSGPIYSDTVGLGNGTPSVSVDLVEITKSKMFFDGQNDYQGILGLGPQGNAVQGTTGYMPAVLMAGVPSIFAFQLCDTQGSNAGTMWLGGSGSAELLTYTPMVPISNENPFYAINVDAVSLGSTSVVANASATFAQPVLDTGTSLFYVPTSVFNSFQTALAASSGFKAVFGTKTFATSGQNEGCVTDASVTDAQVESGLPPIVLSLPNMTSGQPDVTIQASALDTYLYNGGDGTYCLAIQDGGTQDPSTFGDAFMQAFITVVDIQNSRIGFAANGCVAPQLVKHRHPAKNGPHRAPRPARH